MTSLTPSRWAERSSRSGSPAPPTAATWPPCATSSPRPRRPSCSSCSRPGSKDCIRSPASGPTRRACTSGACTLGTETGDSDKNVLDVRLVSSDKKFKPDRYTVVQPQGVDVALGPWIGEVTRKDFLSQIGHAIVHSKVLVIDPRSEAPVVVTGSHNFSAPASEQNDESLVIVRGQKKLAIAYAVYVMSVYQHYRYRSYIREMLAQGKTPWSYLDDDDQWLKNELKSKAQEIGYWT